MKKTAKLLSAVLAALMLLTMSGVGSAQTFEDETAAIEATNGLWVLDEGCESDIAYIYMGGVANFEAYYHSNATYAIADLTYVDEYDNGSGRLDAYDSEGNYVGGFYFDSATQIHFGNDAGASYTRLEDGWEDAQPEWGVLVPSVTFTGLIADDSNNYYGGYYYADQTEDYLTMIINCGFLNDIEEDEEIEDYIARCAALISKLTVDEVNDLSVESNENLTAATTFPAYTLSWTTGENEDTRRRDGVIVLTDNYTYMYIFDTTIDNADEMHDTWMDAIDGLTLVFDEDIEADASDEAEEDEEEEEDTAAEDESDPGDYGVAYYWEDENGDIWYWDGVDTDTYIGSSDAWYIGDDGEVYQYSDPGDGESDGE